MELVECDECGVLALVKDCVIAHEGGAEWCLCPVCYEETDMAMSGFSGPSIDLDYNGDYVVIQLCDRNVTASIQINNLHDLIEINNRILNVIDRWSEREAEMHHGSTQD